MSNLNSAFDVLRGWPNGSGLAWDFAQKDSVVDIVEGTVVAVETDGAGGAVVDRHESTLLVGDNPDHPWLVIQGADQYDADFTGMLTCLKLRTGIVFKVATSLTPTVGDLLWADSDGVLTSTDPAGGIYAVGKVIEFNATDGYMVVES
jgi:hypothetical protein